MDLFLKTVAAVLVSVVLILILDKQHIALLLSAVVCTMVASVAISYLTPVKELLLELQELAGLQSGLLGILLKCAGIALLSELAVLICKDAGISSLGMTIQFLGNSVILFLSIPAFQALLTLLKDMLSEL